MDRYVVKPPQKKDLVQGFAIKEEDYRPAYEAIHFHIVDTATGKHTGDHFENEADAARRATELNRLNP